MRHSRTRIVTLALAVMATGPAPAQEVGKASAVNPAATANLRTITIGASITHKERIKTAAAGSVQILFVDKTSMTIGPNSDLTIDEYVYDPNAGTGKLAATLGKGAMRFVGGQISHTGDAEIKTANAVIGIRGGVALISIQAALISIQNVYAGYGTSTVTSGGASVTLGAGEFTQTAGGQPPAPPAPPPPGFVANLIQSFQSASGQTGGAPTGTASPANVARAELRATGSSGGAVAGSLTPTPPVPQVVRALGSTTTATLNQTIQTSAQSAVVETTARDLRPAVTLTGFLGGLDRWLMRSNIFNQTITGKTQITLDPQTNRVQAFFTDLTVDVNNPRKVNETGSFGSLDPSQPANSSYVSYDQFTATTPGGLLDSEGQSLSGGLYSVSRETARQRAAALGAPNLTICECEYTRWGGWDLNANNTETDRIIGTWVAGRPTIIGEVPTVGRATYIGHVVAHAQDTSRDQYGYPIAVGDARLAGGNFTNTVDFGARTGAVTVTGLDRTNYAGTVRFLNDPRSFAGTLAGDYGNRQMGLLGSFFRGSSSPVGEMGGSVLMNGTNYVGSGIFAARMK
jgi:hypothetical protein